MTADHPRTIGPYEVLGVLGKGAMGQVYKAVQPSLNRLVAIKVLPAKFVEDEERVERFEREAQAVALLNHPNVVQIIEKDREEELLYFVMEYVPGTSLEAVMKQRRLSLHEAFRVAKGICRGLEAAHRQNIVHRDLNPRNVLVSEDLSVVKLADFGISRVEEISRQQGTLSTSEVSLGTLHYMSPEQTTNMMAADHRTDIYSLGVTLYEMLTGRVPVGRFSLPSQLNNEVPSDIDPLVLKCLEVEPSNRYATVTQVLVGLDRLEDRLKMGLVRELKGIGKQTSRIFQKGTGSFRRRKSALLIATAALLLGGGVAAFLLLGRGAPVAAPVAAAPEVAAPETVSPEMGAAPAEERQAVTFELPDRPTGTVTDGGDDSLAGRLAELEAPPPDDPTGDATAAVDDLPPLPEATTPTAAQEDLAVARDKLAAGLNDPALADLQRFVDLYPNSSGVAEAYLLMAQAHLAEGRTEQALATYVEIGSRFGTSPQAPAALFERARLAAAGSGRDASQQARQLYATVAADFPASRWAPAALAAQAQIENELKLTANDSVLGQRVPASVLPCRSLVEGYPSSAEAEWAFWQLGEVYADLKKYELSAKSFSELGRRFPQTRFDAWWRAGQIYDRRLDKKQEALDAYNQVPERSSHHSDAQKRIGRLSR